MKLNFAESLLVPCVSEGVLDPAGSEAGNGKTVSKEVGVRGGGSPHELPEMRYE